MERGQKKPLYRKVNRTCHGQTRYQLGGDFRDERRSCAPPTSMHSNLRRGWDYTPLFKFLLSRVGMPWEPTLKEAVARLDNSKPIFWMVELGDPAKANAITRCGESSYYSRLYIDATGLLQVIDPTITAATMRPYCRCCTHTLNGQLLTQKPEF